MRSRICIPPAPLHGFHLHPEPSFPDHCDEEATRNLGQVPTAGRPVSAPLCCTGIPVGGGRLTTLVGEGLPPSPSSPLLSFPTAFDPTFLFREGIERNAYASGATWHGPSTPPSPNQTHPYSPGRPNRHSRGTYCGGSSLHSGFRVDRAVPNSPGPRELLLRLGAWRSHRRTLPSHHLHISSKKKEQKRLSLLFGQKHRKS